MDDTGMFPAEAAMYDLLGIRIADDPTCTQSADLCLRIRGAGGDGGSTGAESRSSYLDMYKEKKEDKVDPAQQRHAKWTQCSYSGNPLKMPIVADIAGSLFNKADLLEGLAAKAMGAPWPEKLSHIRMKELFSVNPQLNPSYTPAQAGAEEGVRPGAEAPFQCPLTGTPLNGRNRTYLHKPSGLLLSESGLKKVPKVAQEIILEACKRNLEFSEAAGGSALEGKKKSKKGSAVATRATLEAIVARGGKWEDSEMLVVNPEGDDAENAKALLHCLNVKAKSKVKNGDANDKAAAPAAAKRPAPGPVRAPHGDKKTKTVLQSLFHEDGGGAVVKETYLCRSVGARGFAS